LTDFNIGTPPANGTVIINPDSTFTYTPDIDFCGVIDSFTYIITNQFGSSEATVYIDVSCDVIMVYDGFSPNGDGINDGFIILGIENFPDATVYLFNRWGNLIYDKKGYSNNDPWTGRWDGDELPSGTYFYSIIAADNTQLKSGWVQVWR